MIFKRAHRGEDPISYWDWNWRQDGIIGTRRGVGRRTGAPQSRRSRRARGRYGSSPGAGGGRHATACHDIQSENSLKHDGGMWNNSLTKLTREIMLET